MNDTPEKLLTCPFCGSCMEDRGYGAVHLVAGKCPIGDLAIDVTAWNARAALPASPGVRVDARKVIQKRIDMIISEEGSHEWDTNVTNLPEWAETAVEELEGILAALDATAPDAVAEMRYETEMEHIARDMREGRFPKQSEPKMVAEDWRCAGCGSQPPFDCACATDFAHVPGKNKVEPKSAVFTAPQPDAVEPLVKVHRSWFEAEYLRTFADMQRDDLSVRVIFALSVVAWYVTVAALQIGSR